MMFKLTLFICLTLVIQQKLFAATVASIHGKHIQLEQDAGDNFSEDQKFYLINIVGKRVGLIKILSASSNKITALLLKGKASEGDRTKSASSNASTSIRLPKSLLVLVLGLNTNSLTTSDSLNNAYSLSGQSLAFEINQESFLDNDFTARYGIELNNFSAKAKLNNFNQNVNVLYLGFKGDLNYFLSQDFYGGIGFSYLIPTSKSSEYLFAKEDINNNAAVSISLGNWIRGKNTSIPIMLKYSHFLGNKNVSASIIGLQIGLAW